MKYNFADSYNDTDLAVQPMTEILAHTQAVVSVDDLLDEAVRYESNAINIHDYLERTSNEAGYTREDDYDLIVDPDILPERRAEGPVWFTEGDALSVFDRLYGMRVDAAEMDLSAENDLLDTDVECGMEQPDDTAVQLSVISREIGTLDAEIAHLEDRRMVLSYIRDECIQELTVRLDESALDTELDAEE